MRTRGIIYSATGAAYVGEAIASATSSLRYNDLPHLIFCDNIPSISAPAGIEFSTFAPSGEPFLDKIRTIRRSLFEQTIFLDTDTFVTANVSELFDLLKRFDIAATHAPGYIKCNDRGQSEAFYDFNTGVIVYRTSVEMDKFLAAWETLYSAWSAAPPFRPLGTDQPSFRRALWESRLSVYVFGPEYNYRIFGPDNYSSRYPGRLVGKAKIIHGRSTNYEKLAAYLNAHDGPRIFPRFPPD
ncbi:MAG: hypothetical protein ACLPKT_25560 [Methylocella sp.]